MLQWDGIFKYVVFLIGAGGRPKAPVAEGGPVSFLTGGTDGTGSPGCGGRGRPPAPNGIRIARVGWKKNCKNATVGELLTRKYPVGG